MIVSLVQFKDVGKKYYFSFKDEALKEKDHVVVETVRGVEIGQIYQFKDIDESAIQTELKPIIRKATEEDLIEDEYNKKLEFDVTKKAKDLAKTHQLEMKILQSEYTLDRKRLMIYFESENRVDFRELVKDLNELFHTRIELRQIGPRDAAKLIGGIGPCGLILCCTTFIGEFDTVSIKMAKNQNIALNPQKISGVCGKLLCCIKYEDDVYTKLREDMPDLGTKITTEQGKGVVIGVNILGRKVKIRYYEDDSIEWVALHELEFNH